MSNQEGIKNAFNEYFEQNFYEDVKIMNHYESKSDKFIIIITQNEKEIYIDYKYNDINELQQCIKNYFSHFYRNLSYLIINNGSKYLNNDKEILTESCCVCFDDYKDNKKILSCGHSVCIECNKKIEKKCPYCRKKNINSKFDLYEEIKKIVNNGLSIIDEIKEFKKIFNFDEFIKNEITFKIMKDYKLFDYIADDGDYFVYENGIISYKIFNGDLQQNKHKYECWAVCSLSMVEQLTMRIKDLSRDTIQNQIEIDKIRRQVNFYLKMIKC